MSWARTAHRWLATLLVAGVVSQFFLAGAGAFGAASFDLHAAVGWTLAAAAVVALLLGALGLRHVKPTALLLALVAVQWVLGSTGREQEPWLGALHGLNALAVLAVAGNLARRAWTTPRGETA